MKLSKKKEPIRLVTFLLMILLLASCSNDNINAPKDTRRTFEINLVDYSNNHFFLDTMYASVLPEYNFYSRYHKSYIPWVNPYYTIKNLKIWKLATGFNNYAMEKYSNAFINLPPKNFEHGYDSTFYNTNQISILGENMINERFEVLEQDIDYIYNPYTGEVTFLFDVVNYNAFAATYSIEGETNSDSDDIVFGDYLSDYPSDSTAILKLFKPENLNPSYKQAWKLQLRNIYQIGIENIIADGFELEISININGKFQNYIEKWGKPVSLLTEFELDNIDIDSNYNPDGKFDFLNNITINPILGEITLPSLEPFGRDLPKSIPDSFKVFSLYEKMKSIDMKTDIPFKITGKYNN